MAEILLHSDITQPRNPWKPATRIHDRGVVSLSSVLEIPRNSIDDILTCQVRHRPFEGSISHNTAAKKKLIHKHMPSQPSVIARLMGMDTILIPAKGAVMIQAEETSNLKPPSAAETKVTTRQSTPFKQSKCSLLSYHSRNGDYRHCLKKMRSRRSGRSRHPHPQEELFQKMKEDFQAWQTSKVLDTARTVAELGRSKPSLDGRYIQILAQENLRKEKLARYGYGSNNMMESKFTLKNVAQEGNSEIVTEKVAAESNSEEMVVKVSRATHRAESEKCRALEAGMGEHDHSMPDKLRAPTRIVILRPSSELGVDDREPLFGSSKVKRDDNMEVFLEEVKERLKKELKVKARGEVRTPRGTDPRQIARDIAKQIRETVAKKDLGKRLSRSESFRAFRSDRKENAVARHASPEHVMFHTRNIAAHRLSSVNTSTAETVSEEKAVEDCRGSPPIRSGGRVRSLTDVSLSGIGFDERSWTSECLMKHAVGNVVSVDAGVVSCRALVRSFSAPASGISHVRLFLEDGVGSRKHGTSDIASEGAAVAIKSSNFSFRETVSNLRHSFSLGGKLLGRKMHWSEKKPSLGEMDIGTTQSSPQASGRFGVAQANFTEPPPSPDPVSPLEVEEGHSSRHCLSDLISCTIPELSPKCWSEFEAPISERSSYETNTTADTESSSDKAYIREVLITAGLCSDDGSLDKEGNAWVDSIRDCVFEEVEEAYRYRGKKAAKGDDEIGGLHSGSSSSSSSTEEAATDHRMLFDLANEALQNLVASVKSGCSSSVHHWVVVDGSGMSRGRKLLHVDDVWQQVQALRDPPAPTQQQRQTIDSMVACQVRKSPAWADVLLLYEDVYVVGRKIERAICDELIGDIVREGFV